MLKNRPEQNKTDSIWTGSRFGPDYINREYYFLVQLNFWVKTGPNRTVNTPNVYSSIKSIKTLYRALDWKYKARDVGI